MSKSKALNQLRAAASTEYEGALSRAQRHAALTAKIHAYQSGMGAAPSVEEFQQWREDVERTVALRRLQGGLSGA